MCGNVVFVEDSSTPTPHHLHKRHFSLAVWRWIWTDLVDLMRRLMRSNLEKLRMIRTTVRVMTLMLALQEDRMLDSEIRNASLVVPDNHLESGGKYSPSGPDVAAAAVVEKPQTYEEAASSEQADE